MDITTVEGNSDMACRWQKED